MPILDTGHAGAIQIPRAKLGDIRLVGGLVHYGTARTVNSSFKIYRSRLRDDLRFADHEFSGVRVTVHSMPGSPLIGAALFKRSVLTFDQKNSLLRVVNSPPRGKAAPKK